MKQGHSWKMLILLIAASACSGPSTSPFQFLGKKGSTSGPGFPNGFTNPFSDIHLIQIAHLNTRNNRETVIDQIILANGDTLSLVEHRYNPQFNNNEFVRAAVVKMDSQGELDSNFGSDGIASIDYFSGSLGEIPKAFFRDASTGAIFVVSEILNYNSTSGTLERDIGLAKLTGIGQYDLNFSNLGRKIIDIKTDVRGATSGASDDSVVGMHLNGTNLYVAGATDAKITNLSHFANVIYLLSINPSNGNVNSTVGSSGQFTNEGITAYTNNFKRFKATDFGVDSQGRMIVAANMFHYNIFYSGAHQIAHALFRFNANGTLDGPTGSPQTGFRWTGIKTHTADCLSGNPPVCYAATDTKIKILSNNKILMGLSAREITRTTGSQGFTWADKSKVAFHRVLTNGFEDTFGNYAGSQSYQVFDESTLIGMRDIEVDPLNGKIYASLHSYAVVTSPGPGHQVDDLICNFGAIGNSIHLMRMDANGLAFDSTFAGQGTRSLDNDVYSWVPHVDLIATPSGCSMSADLKPVIDGTSVEWRLLGGGTLLNPATMGFLGMIYQPSLPQ